MITTLEQIHHDPAIIDRAINRQERLDIVDQGHVAATLLPSAAHSVEAARSVMRDRFAALDWNFAVGNPMTRDERNSRG